MNNKMILCSIVVFFTSMIVAGEKYFTFEAARSRVAEGRDLCLYNDAAINDYLVGQANDNSKSLGLLRITGDLYPIENMKHGNYEIVNHEKFDVNDIVFKENTIKFCSPTFNIVFDQTNAFILLSKIFYLLDRRSNNIECHYLHLISEDYKHNKDTIQTVDNCYSLKLTEKQISFFELLKEHQRKQLKEQDEKRNSTVATLRTELQDQEVEHSRAMDGQKMRLQALENLHIKELMQKFFGCSCLGLVIIFMAYLKFR